MSLTVKRVIAYLFDIVVVSLVSSLISTTTINPNYERRLTLNEEYTEKMKEFEDKRGELDESNQEEVKEYIREKAQYSNEYILESSKAMLFENSVSIVALFLYFVVFAYFFEGETVGKRLVKIRVVKKEGERVSIGNLIIRLIILHGLPFVILNTVFAFILNSSSYFIFNSIIYILTLGLELTILITVFANSENRGLHDMIAGTKVVER